MIAQVSAAAPVTSAPIQITPAALAAKVMDEYSAPKPLAGGCTLDEAIYSPAQNGNGESLKLSFTSLGRTRTLYVNTPATSTTRFDGVETLTWNESLAVGGKAEFAQHLTIVLDTQGQIARLSYTRQSQNEQDVLNCKDLFSDL